MYDKEFGEIILHTRANMRHLTARWHNGVLLVNKPPHVTFDKTYLFIDEYREKIRSLRKKTLERYTQVITRYKIGQRITCFRGEVLICAIDCRPRFTGYKRDENGNMFIFISSKDDIDTDIKQQAISSALKELMKRTAPHVLIPFAHEVAKEIGVSPKEFVIGRGFRKLGHCTAQKTIQLSANLMFMPEELVRYIICHELAHLTEMNHGQAFHTLCNRYCNGNEKNLIRSLKAFSYPLIK